MKHSCPTADLVKNYRLTVKNVELDIVEGKKLYKSTNKLLNGVCKITGTFIDTCPSSNSKISPGSNWKLKIYHNKKHCSLDILVFKIEKITVPMPGYKDYTWSFIVIGSEIDQLGIVPNSNGEISLDELLEEIGFSREEMNKNKRKFDSEGGFSD